MTAARELLCALDSRRSVAMPVAVVTAHPDDETIGAGANLNLLTRLLLVHVTDGAPRDLRDARTAGFDRAEDYAACRRAELDTALRAGGVAAEYANLGAADQEAALHMPDLVRSLAARLGPFAPGCVITHAYEGGHPDHDSTCLIVRLACGRLDPPPAIMEMSSYFANPGGEMIVGGFIGEPAALVVTLDGAERARREAMLDCFATQRATLAPFRGMEHETFRLAPPCDFGAAPHPGVLWYERRDWGMTGVRWRKLAEQALAAWGV
jgi:LmbE family N-acetylglucosaminyl deacetylase